MRGGDDARVAADHRHRMARTSACSPSLGVDAYRFSVAWPRVQPDRARARSASRGLDFYRALVDELLAHGIEPVVTLYHWDLPQALEDAGGWPARDTAERFARLRRHRRPAPSATGCGAGATSTSRGARRCSATPPACTRPAAPSPAAAVAAAHHLLLGHGLAVDALRGRRARTRRSRITLNPYPVVAAGPTDADRDAARRVDGVANRLWYDAVLRGRYPDDVLDDFAR